MSKSTLWLIAIVGQLLIATSLALSSNFSVWLCTVGVFMLLDVLIYAMYDGKERR